MAHEESRSTRSRRRSAVKAREHHPDIGGSRESFHHFQRAKEYAVAELTAR